MTDVILNVFIHKYCVSDTVCGQFDCSLSLMNESCEHDNMCLVMCQYEMVNENSAMKMVKQDDVSGLLYFFVSSSSSSSIS